MSRFSSIKDLVCLVSGGAGTLGSATVEWLVRKGAKAIVCDINKKSGEDLAAKLGAACIYVPTDASSETEVQNALKVCTEKFGRLDVALNCAAVATAIKIINTNSDRLHAMQDFERLLKHNTFATFNVSRLAAQLIAKNKPDADGAKGVIIMTSSIAANEGQLGQTAYAASKGAVAAMTLPMARDLASEGIRVMTIAPGLMVSAMVPRDIKPTIKRYLEDLPLTPKGYGQPETYAQCVETVICNGELNGEIIRLDAGMREEFWYSLESFSPTKEEQLKRKAKERTSYDQEEEPSAS